MFKKIFLILFPTEKGLDWVIFVIPFPGHHSYLPGHPLLDRWVRTLGSCQS